MVSTVFHKLPPELLIKTLNFAAASSSRTCLALCLVSSWIRQLALHHLYTTPCVSSRRQFQLFVSAVTDSDHAAELGFGGRELEASGVVRGVWIEYRPDFPRVYNVRPLVGHCHNLVNLAAGTQAFFSISKSFPDWDFTRFRPLRITVIGEVNAWPGLLRCLKYAHARNWPNLFNVVSHIHFLTAFDYIAQLETSLLPCLSHLAIPITNPRPEYTDAEEYELDPFPMFEQVLASSKIEMLVLVVYPRDKGRVFSRFDVYGWVLQTRKTDPRVFMLEADRGQAQEIWKEEVRGGVSLWQRAVMFTRDWEEARSYPRTLR